MVASLELAGAIRSPVVRDAFLAVRREVFVPEIVARRGLEAIYQPDAVLATATDERGVAISSSSAPNIMAPMLEALELRPGLTVLEVGAGTGYNAALLKEAVSDQGRVTSIDVTPAFADRARQALAAAGYRCDVVVGDGRDGWPQAAPFDRIVVTASSDRVERAWCDQLLDGGLVEVPLRLATGFGLGAVVTFRREGHRLRSTSSVAGGFMPLRDPDESGAEEPGAPDPPQGSLRAVASGSPPTLLASLEGDSVAGLSPAASHRALAALLGPSRRRRTLPPAQASGLSVFVTMSGLRRLVCCSVGGRWGVGVLAANGKGLAAVTRRPGTAGWIESWGDEGAERALATQVRRWERLGRPGLDELLLTVDFGPEEATDGWRRVRTGDSVLTIDWSAASRH